jgi:hypothetical protein
VAFGEEDIVGVVVDGTRWCEVVKYNNPTFSLMRHAASQHNRVWMRQPSFIYFSHSFLNQFLMWLMERSVYEIRLFRGLVAVFALTLAVFDGRLVLENKWRSQQTRLEKSITQSHMSKSENTNVEIFRRAYKI